MTFHTGAYGSALDMKENYLIVGAPEEKSTSGDVVGAAYTYRYDGSNWVAYPSTTFNRIKRTTTVSEKLGSSVAIDKFGSTVLLGTDPDLSRGTYQYEMDGSGHWTAKIHYPNSSGGTDLDNNISMVADGSDIFLNKNDYTANHITITPAGISRPNALKSMVLYKDQMMVNDPDNIRAVAENVPCGILPTSLIKNEWAMISVPCGDGTASIGQLFVGQLGTYGDNANWVMYEQNGTDYSGTTDSNQLMGVNDPMEVGKGYWIIADQNRTVEIATAQVSTYTSIDTVDAGDPKPTEVGGYYEFAIPAANGSVQKVMVGNPYPRTIHWKYVKENDNNILGRRDLGTFFVDPKAYVYDKTQSGQPYRAITATGTPGFNSEIKPFEGFWIKRTATAGPGTESLSIPFEK